MSDNGEEEFGSDGSSYHDGMESESDNASSLDEEVSKVEKSKPTGKKIRKSAAPIKQNFKKRINSSKKHVTTSKTSSSHTKKSSKNTKTSATGSFKRSITELHLAPPEPTSKRQRTIERQARLQMATAPAEDEPLSQQSVAKTAYTQKSRSDAYRISKLDHIIIRNFVYDKGLTGGSQPALLQELFEEIGLDELDEVAIREKMKQKVSNINRTLREFNEMVPEDDIKAVRDPLVNIFKTFGQRPGALEEVKEAIAELEKVAGTS
jgi:hypothetical protein